MKLILKWVISLAIAAVFVVLATKDWPLDQMLCSHVEYSDGRFMCFNSAAPKGTDDATTLDVGEPRGNESVAWSVAPGWLVAAFLVLVVVHFLRVLRWEPLVRPLARFDFWTLNRVGAVSFMVLFIFPLRLGELARPYLIARTGRLRKSAALGTVAVERVMDGLMMALLLAAVLFFLPSTDPAVFVALEAGAWIAIVAFACALVLLVLAWMRRELAVRIVARVFGLASKKLADRLSGMMGAFIDGLKGMPSSRDFFKFLWMTAVYWAINGFFFYFMICAFGLDSQVDLLGAYAMMAAVAVGMMIPNSPANVGSFWYFLLLPTALYNVPTNTATPMAFALSVWAMMLFQYGVFALWYMCRGDESVKGIWSIQKEKIDEDK